MEYFTWNVDPVLISILGLKIHWYGALFAAAILSGLQVMKWIFKQEKANLELLDSLLVYCVIGIILGARLGHCLFYDPAYYLSNPLKIIAIWEGGLASHGGGLGVIIAVYLFQRKFNVSYLWLLDRLAIATALFGFFVRSANFMNSEIIGEPTDVKWAVIFERIDLLPRHPAQLYEALSYLAIFILLISLYKQTKIKDYGGALLGSFLSLVFTARFMIEFVKVKQAAYNSDIWLNTGQLLSIPFFLIGIYLIYRSRNNTKLSSN
ncbi:prolipoprotein diacylglyceryl transferase [Paraglaciecola aquimarina]|uniref:Phosphatidylglycerol--prolipoprotein diacylglyceryl transferase n=1 Tax=Paraglaciecola aquimarina TaxID=1235557 RepID=A0ABU3T1C8_9ALTE|nr:prolipoprotein diacylglyceryl transferase [Paraglaciecola aquimarina]MDU0356055.1 prolipoprotein diacylglyceryl transferase [Paraglaciecola aquimarina]